MIWCLWNLWTTFLQLQSKLYHYSWVGLKSFFPGKLYLATNISHRKANSLYFWCCTHFWFCFFGGECSCCDCLWLPWNKVKYAAVTQFNFISVEYLVEGVFFFGKWVSIRCKKDWAIFVVTLHIWLVKPYNLPLEFFVFAFVVTCAWMW